MYLPHFSWLEARQDQPPQGSSNTSPDNQGSQGGSQGPGSSNANKTTVGIIVCVYRDDCGGDDDEEEEEEEEEEES